MALGLAETAHLAVELSLKGNFESQLAGSRRALAGFDRAITSTQGRAYRAGTQIGTGIKSGALIAAAGIGILASQVAAGLGSLSRLDDVITQSNAALKSTKGVSGQTADSLRNLANKYETLNATIDDTVIQSGANLLLTFTNIRKQAFEPTLAAALNMNQALGGGQEGLSNTIRILGKALNDPLKGLTALQRVGVRFTDDQKKQIATALKAGDTFKAQGVILAELNKRFGGSFLAGGTTTTGKIAKFRDAIDDLQRTLASALLPAIGKVSDRLSTFLSDPKVVAEVSKIGTAIAGLFSDRNLAEGGKILGTLFETAKTAAPVVKAAALATLEIVKAAVNLFRSLPEGIQQLAIGAFAVNKLTGGLVTNIGGGIAGGIAEFLARKFTGAMNVSAGVVNVAGGVGGVGGAVPTAAGSGVKGVLANVLKVAVVGIAAGVIADLAGALSDQNRVNQQQQADIGTNVGNQVRSGTLRSLQQSAAALKTGIAELNKGRPTAGGEGPESRALRAQLKLVQDAIERETTRLAGASIRTKDDLTAAARKQLAATNTLRDRIEAQKVANVTVSVGATIVNLNARGIAVVNAQINRYGGHVGVR